ncbi:MAG: hypothetical protein V3W41_13365 [Planctomycetota bacterium]
MACEAAPGVDHCVTLDTDAVRVTVNGVEVPYTAVSAGGGKYKITVAGASVTCPGPLVIKDAAGKVLQKCEVKPC